MGLKELILGTPEQRRRRKELKLKEKEAYRKGYEKGRIKRAKEAGYRKGKGSKKKGGSFLEGVQNVFAGVESAMKGAQAGAENFLGDFEVSTDLDFGLGAPPRRRKKSKKKRR